MRMWHLFLSQQQIKESSEMMDAHVAADLLAVLCCRSYRARDIDMDRLLLWEAIPANPPSTIFSEVGPVQQCGFYTVVYRALKCYF